MAYKNVGTPVFYVDLLGWLKSHGLLKVIEGNVYVSPSAMDLIGIDPSSTKKLTPLALGGAPGSSSWGGDTDFIKYQLQGIDQTFNQLMPNDKNFSMILGHNLQTATAEFLIQAGGDTSGGEHSVVARGSYVNFPPNDSATEYDGFSIARANDAHEIDIDRIQFRFDSVPEGDGYTTPSINIGSLAYGTYYEMPHSPELKLTMTREMDGIKRTRTKGGSDLTNRKYTTQPTWDGEAAWELWLGMPTLIQDPDGDSGDVETDPVVPGCMDENACTQYNPEATEDDGSCDPPQWECPDGNWVCDGLEYCSEEGWIYGCMDDGWCVDHEPNEIESERGFHFCNDSFDHDGGGYQNPDIVFDDDGNAEFPGVTACNFNEDANQHDYSCDYLFTCETADEDGAYPFVCNIDDCPEEAIDPGDYGDNNWHWILEIWDWMFPENEDLESDEAYLFSCNPADWTAQNKVFPTDPTSQVKDYNIQVGETSWQLQETGWSDIAGSFKWIFTYGEMCPNQFGISITEDDRWDPFDCGPNYAAAQQFALDAMEEYGDILTGAYVLQEGGEWVQNISWDDWNDFEFVDNYCQILADNCNCVPGTAALWYDTWICDEVDLSLYPFLYYSGHSPNSNIVNNIDETFMQFWDGMLQNFELCPHVYGRCSNPNVYNMQGRSSRSSRTEGTSNPALARAGRRVWDLSFSYLDSTDSLGVNQSWNGLYDVESTGYSTDDLTLQEDAFNVNLLTDDSFFAQVIHKTNGGQLPFVFQPDSNNKNPDQFAICKLDMKSFQFKQVSNGIYDIKLKIREVW